MSASWGPSARDRTQEFASLVDMYRAQLSAAAASSSSASSSSFSLSATPQARVPLPPPRGVSSAAAAAPAPPSQFSEAAKGINAGITSVATKLQDLTKLAKSTSLFNDNSSQIAELTAVCKQDLMLLNGEVEALERWVENGGGSSHGQSKSHSQQVVFNLKSQLGNQARSFAHLLTLRSKSIKEQSDRRKQFTSGSSLQQIRKRPLLTHGADTSGGGALAFDPCAPDAGNSGAAAAAAAGDSGAGGLQYQVMLEDQSEQYVASRAQAVQQIESTIQELAQMYQRLAVLVKTQEEQAVRLDMTVEETLEHTESAHTELTKYYEWVQGNRWLMLKVFAALIFFAVIFVAFVQ